MFFFNGNPDTVFRKQKNTKRGFPSNPPHPLFFLGGGGLSSQRGKRSPERIPISPITGGGDGKASHPKIGKFPSGGIVSFMGKGKEKKKAFFKLGKSPIPFLSFAVPS